MELRLTFARKNVLHPLSRKEIGAVLCVIQQKGAKGKVVVFRNYDVERGAGGRKYRGAICSIGCRYIQNGSNLLSDYSIV